jgi:cystathionine beta-lyase/cystathionine gamma-synthase
MEFSFVDTRDPERIEKAVQHNTRAILIETPSNPLMRVTDIRAAADIAHRHSAVLIVDNTFASPVFQRPFELGADVVFHSTTKYLNGHSDMVGGIALVKDDGLAEKLQFIANAAGAIPGPFDSWLALRGTKTLHLRMKQHDINGRAIARWLVEQLGAESVMYVGLASHPQHELAKRQMSGFGGMISIELGTRERAAHVLKSVKLFALAETVGGVESLISHPASMTHTSVAPDFRARLGITDGLVRLSCGVEETEDLLADLEQAFTKLPERKDTFALRAS